LPRIPPIIAPNISAASPVAPCAWPISAMWSIPMTESLLFGPRAAEVGFQPTSRVATGEATG